MRILALEPYYGGSHKAFLDGWQVASRHDWTVFGLPPHQWKWRMRHAAVTLAEQVTDRLAQRQTWDVVLCSDMLNLAEFKGRVGAPVAALPAVGYFHENQLTYPVRHETERDLHFAYTNFTTALAADHIWFNSRFHLESFHTAVRAFLSRMPDFNCLHTLDNLRARSVVYPQGISRPAPRSPRPSGPAHLLWAARWEHDKNPAAFIEALQTLAQLGLDFRVSVIGQQFSETPAVFAQARQWLGERIIYWGFQDTREEYERALGKADVFVSTAGPRVLRRQHGRGHRCRRLPAAAEPAGLSEITA
jgi:glycosyltransferase involved in cell wall biosynthesis